MRTGTSIGERRPFDVQRRALMLPLLGRFWALAHGPGRFSVVSAPFFYAVSGTFFVLMIERIAGRRNSPVLFSYPLAVTR